MVDSERYLAVDNKGRHGLVITGKFNQTDQSNKDMAPD